MEEKDHKTIIDHVVQTNFEDSYYFTLRHLLKAGY